MRSQTLVPGFNRLSILEFAQFGRYLELFWKIFYVNYTPHTMLERFGTHNDNVSRKHQGPDDFAETAFRVFQEAIGEVPKTEALVKNPAAVELGRLGGLKGGKARASKLSAEQRSEIAKKAAQSRWHKGE